MRLNKDILKFTIFVFVFFGYTSFTNAALLQSDLNQNGIPDSDESDVIVQTSATLPAGEYFFNNLTITNNAILTLEGDPTSLDDFKGVKVNVNNLIITFGARISADARGYITGPGSPLNYYNDGASHGGLGGGVTAKSTYGSAIAPFELGSGTENRRGGGAIRLVISGTLQNDGRISADGIYERTSGGSLYITTDYLDGNGIFSANGGNTSWPYQYSGGGGRVAIYYQNSSFGGTATTRAGLYCFYGCNPAAEAGTVGFFDTSNDTLNIFSSWRFQNNDSPFNFSSINFKNGAKVTTENDVTINSTDLLIDQGSSFVLLSNQVLNISNITITGGSVLTLSGEETINTNNLLINGNSTVTVVPERVLYLKVANLTVNTGSFISVDNKGYIYGPGSPVVNYQAGASYGGKGGGATAKPVYGSDIAPVDFGSGTEGRRGGGAIRLEISNTLQNDGRISANGTFERNSGGSVYVTTGSLQGSGSFQANGGNSSWPYESIAGGGGRIAIYYQGSSFTGTAVARGGVYCFYGCAPAAENGTVIMNFSEPVCTVNCFSNVLFLPGLEASRLYKTRVDGSEDQLWEPNGNSDVVDLYLNPDGTSINPNIYTRDIIDEGQGIKNIYKSFINTMNQLVVDQKIVEWKSYAYDWRQSIDDIVNNGTKYQNNTISLVDTLQSLINSSKSGKVTIVTHSNGGLLAKALLKKLQDDKTAGINNLIDNVDVLILVAVPEIGTASAVPAILHGYKQNILGGLLLDESHARELGRNMPGAYGLLPSREYINRVSASPVTFISSVFDPVTTKLVQTFGSAISSYDEYKDFLFGAEGRINPDPTQTNLPISLSQNLFYQAESLHDSIDAFVPPASLQVIEVAGWGLDTIASFEYYPICDNSNSIDCTFILDERPRFTSDGDGTVVVPSAHYMSLNGIEKYWLNLFNVNEDKLLFATNNEHKNILEIPSLLNFISYTIQDLSFNSVYLTNIAPIDTLNRFRISIHSPVTIDAYDTNENHTGKVCSLDSDFCYVEENIPNSSYLEFGEGKYINLPEDQMSEVKLQGIDIGTFTYNSEKVLPDGTSTTSSFVDIPVTTQTQAEITLNSDTGAPEMSLDVTGDGVSDFTLTPNAIFDPVTYLQIMKVTINSLDLPKGKIESFNNRVDNIIKSIQKGKVDQAKLKADKFKIFFEKTLSKQDSKTPKPHKLSKTDAQLLLDMLNKLLDNLN